MSKGLFFSNIEVNELNREILTSLESYSERTATQIYVIQSALGAEEKYQYSYEDALVILIPKHYVCIVNLNDSSDEDFDEYYEDFIEDLGYLSDKFDYKKMLGRPKAWRNDLICKAKVNDIDNENINSFIEGIFFNDPLNERKVDFLISLLTGSINDVERLGVDTPEDTLEKIKKKIVLFDGDQSRFIFEKINKKRITIQGLAGTGKTELLLHKLKELYTTDKESKIVFTCFNKILSQNMKTRIPEFFNFMRIEEQIKWDERLWVISSWGSKYSKNTGLYSYICSYYNLNFQTYSYFSTFDKVCTDAINELKALGDYEKCFDYILIDESQDFPKSFFDLCEMVTSNTIYIAGDIFQDIYDRTIEPVKSDFLLNKCYRTDPRTLMFAHAVGMGLYEKPVIRWLDDKEWLACGYDIKREDNSFILSRTPLRRFEDLQSSDLKSVEIIESNDSDYSDKIINIIKQIRKDNPSVCPDDIGIVFLESIKSNYALADLIEIQIRQTFHWNVTKGYETKDKLQGSVFISNRNNVKGLEFPFVICIVKGYINDNIHTRNSMYMMLTRSFLTSYFMVNSINVEFIRTYTEAINQINDSSKMILREPSQEEKDAQNQKVIIESQAKRKTMLEIINEVIIEYPKLTNKHKDTIRKTIPEVVEDNSEDEIRSKTLGMINLIIGGE